MKITHDQHNLHHAALQGGLHSQILEKNAEVKAIYNKFVSISALIPFKKANKQFWNMSPTNKNKSADKFENLQKTKNESEAKMVHKEMQRRVKKYKRKKLFEYRFPTEQNDSYLQTYKNYLKNNSSNRSKIYSESKQIDLGLPQGICQYSLLKNHPNIVQYTLQKIKAKRSKHLQFQYLKYKEPELKRELDRGQLILKSHREQLRRKRLLICDSPKSINTTRETATTPNASECYQLVNEVINSSRVTLKKIKITLNETGSGKKVLKMNKPERSYTQIVNNSSFN